jgi:hypothetical protein
MAWWRRESSLGENQWKRRKWRISWKLSAAQKWWRNGYSKMAH